MSKKAGKILIILGAFLVLAASGLFIYNETESNRAGEASQKIISELKNSDTNFSDTSDGMKVIAVDGYEYIGRLTIPSLNLELPIMSKWDNERMKLAPCLYYGSYKTDDMVIAAHNYKKHFGVLKNLQINDELYFTDAENRVYHYTVAAVDILQPDQIEEMIDSDFDLTLYTCTYGGKERLTVRCLRK